MELHVIPVADPAGPEKFILYRPMVGLAFVGNRTMADLARSLAGREGADRPDCPAEIETFLRSIGFFDPDPPPPDLPGRDYRPSMAVLLLTNQCQLRCQYCYAAAGERARQFMPLAIARAAIDRVHANAAERGLTGFEISYHGGGEPTFAWHVLQESVRHARQKSLPARITLTSNGVWSPAQRAWILENIDGLSLSMDGRPEHQDRVRPLVSGRGSSEWVMRTVAALDEARFSYGIRMTATAPWEELPRNVQFLCEETGCESIQVEPAYSLTRGGHIQGEREQAQAFARAYLEAFDIAQDRGRRFYFAGARLGLTSSTFCNAPFTALVVDPDGNLVTCYEVTDRSHPLAPISSIGHVDADRGEISIDLEARARLHALIAERRATCRDCYCYWTCAGDCYTRTFEPEPGGHLPHGVRCELNRELAAAMLLNQVARGGGVWHAGERRSRRTRPAQKGV